MYNSGKTLRRILIEELKDYKGEPIKLPYEEQFLRNILFDDDNYLGAEFAPELEEVLTKINYSDINFYNFKAVDFDFSPYTGIRLDPKIIWKKDLSNSICKGVEFIGTFYDVIITGTDFTGSKGAKINPQCVHNKNLSNAVCCDVEFVGFNNLKPDFSHTIISGADFTGSNYELAIDEEKEFREKVRSVIYSKKYIK